MNWYVTGALLSGVGVAIGAFGAHGIQERVSEDLLATFETGARYHMYHALALLAVGSLKARSPLAILDAAGIAFVIGIVLFSGSLYTMTLTGARWLGAITPLGGLAFLVGWGLLARGAHRSLP